MPVEHPVTCPHCKDSLPLASSIFPDDDATPGDGDISICFQCGMPSIFDTRAEGGARYPSPDEWGEIINDPAIRNAMREVEKVIRAR